MAIQSTMMDYPLTLTQVLLNGVRAHRDAEILTWTTEGTIRRSFAETFARVGMLAAGLRSIGVGSADVVASFCWNRQEHLEAYFAVPCIGAALHTLNIRLHPGQLAYAIRDSGASVIIVEASLIDRLEPALEQVDHVRALIVIDGPAPGGSGQVRFEYEELLASSDELLEWPRLDESSAAMICHTSGTTGNPKGVAYSHRSQWIHTFGTVLAGLGVDERTRMLQVVPQFHANGWGLIYACWAVGADIMLPGEHADPASLARFIEEGRPTHAAAVPTVWAGLLAHADQHSIDLSSLQELIIGGSAVPRSLIERFHERYGIPVLQAWGMTETSPLGAVARPPRLASAWEEEVEWRSRTGRLLPSLDARIIDGGLEQPWDDASVGELQVRGPCVTGSYLGGAGEEQFTADGWFRTGDIVAIDPNGFMRIVDRAKDIIKSGGEWISSVDLETILTGHPEVLEACVVGVADERWDERPLAAIVLRPGAELDVPSLAEWLEARVARWWVPDHWVAVDEIPKTSVGKFDKKKLRSDHDEGRIRSIERA